MSAGLKGEKLAGRLDKLASEVEALVTRLEARPVGTFGTAFFESLITIVREGVEVILVLAMLIALVAKAAPTDTKPKDGPADRDATRAGDAGDLVGRGAGRRRQPGDRGGLEPAGLLDAGPGARDPRRGW